jgi:hypothetical protein
LPDVPALKRNPVFLYYPDGFQKPNPFQADVAVAIDQVIEKKAKARNLELDFLRLVYAVEHFWASGDEAQGYLLVLTEPLRWRIRRWVTKYDAQDCVELLVASLTQEQTRLLDLEKKRNRRGNAPGADPALASAAYGKKLGEDALRMHVLSAEPGVMDMPAAAAPIDVNWDFYGVIS